LFKGKLFVQHQPNQQVFRMMNTSTKLQQTRSLNCLFACLRCHLLVCAPKIVHEEPWNDIKDMVTTYALSCYQWWWFCTMKNRHY